MATNIERVTEQAMRLPPESRAALASRLVESLDAEEIGRIDRLWLDEAKRRRDDRPNNGVEPTRTEMRAAELWRSPSAAGWSILRA